MAVDILAWIKIIEEIGPGLAKTLDTINLLRFKWVLKGAELEKVKKDIQEVSEKTAYVKKIGEILQYYIDYSVDTRVLDYRADKLRELIIRYETDLSDKNSIHWGSVENLFHEIRESHKKFTNIALQRVVYIDQKDAADIKNTVDNIDRAFTAAETSLKTKGKDELKRQIEELSTNTLKLHEIFKNSSRNITNGLMKI